MAPKLSVVTFAADAKTGARSSTGSLQGECPSPKKSNSCASPRKSWSTAAQAGAPDRPQRSASGFSVGELGDSVAGRPPGTVLLEATMSKQSRWVKQWRTRLISVEATQIRSYKGENRSSARETEALDYAAVEAIAVEGNVLRISSQDRHFNLRQDEATMFMGMIDGVYKVVRAAWLDVTVKRLLHPKEGIRKKSGEILAQVDSQSVIGPLSRMLAEVLTRAGDRKVERRLVEEICRHPQWLRTKDVLQGSSVLHVAASTRNVEACKMFIQAGAPLILVNRDGNTPFDVALSLGDKDSAAVLQGNYGSTSGLTGGDGMACRDALQDTGRVVRLRWYVINLNSSKHSALSVTVRGDDGDERRYAIEKVKSAGMNDTDYVQNGVYVSHWLALAPIVAGKDFREEVTEHDLESPSVTIRRLHALTLALDASTDSHEAALTLFNSCAKEQKKASRVSMGAVSSGVALATEGMRRATSMAKASVPSTQSTPLKAIKAIVPNGFMRISSRDSAPKDPDDDRRALMAFMADLANFTPKMSCADYIRTDCMKAFERVKKGSGSILPKLIEKADRMAEARVEKNTAATARRASGDEREGIFAIVCYTLDMRDILKKKGCANFFDLVNRTLRTYDQELLVLMQGYLYYFTRGLQDIPAPPEQEYFRGLPAKDLGVIRDNYAKDTLVRYTGVTSVTPSMRAAQVFAKNGGVILHVTANSARSIRELSAYPEEQEALLMPGFTGVVTSEPKLKSGLWHVEIREAKNMYCF